MRPPDSKRAGPEGTNPGTRPNVKATATALDLLRVQRGQVTDMAAWRARRRGACWRCGVPFAATDTAALRRCLALAQRAGRREHGR